MTWNWEEISTTWLRESEIAIPQETVVAAFDRAEALLGRGWIESSRLHGGLVTWGAVPTLRVVWMGQRLASLDGAARAEELLERLRQNDASAESELTAIHLIRDGRADLDLELAPPTAVGLRIRHPDFRIRQAGVWTYVEVTRADVSEARARAEDILHRLIQVIHGIKRSFSLEVFLRREPSDSEIGHLAERLPTFCLQDGVQREDMPSLAILSLNYSQPGMIVPLEHPGEKGGLILGGARGIGGGAEPPRHIAVRMPFEDTRAEAFLTQEAKQLPTDAPGLVMIDLAGALGGFESWDPLLRRRFQPKVHTRVGGVCLFMTAQYLTDSGSVYLTETKLLINPHAALPLPSWATDALTQAGTELKKHRQKTMGQ